MFRYEDFPTIAAARKERIRLTNAAFKAELKAHRKKTEIYEARWDEAVEKRDAFVINGFAKAVFDLFAPLKPDLTAPETGRVYTWDELYGDNFAVLSDIMKSSLPMLVEEESPYRLPDKYYYDAEEEREIRRIENEKSDKMAQVRRGIRWLMIAAAIGLAFAFIVYIFEA
ncbi:MAG: hypothetical protein K2L42_00760 [Clostridia bacterium]|nr:hypothetical protein [Clostridia bacterium]